MSARKKRTKTNPKLVICQEQENYDLQSSKSRSDMETYNDEAKIMKRYDFKEEFEFSLADIKNWESFVQFMYRPMDPASLGLIRIMFGFMMILDVPEERGLADADINWGDPDECRFPLFDFLQPLPLQWMCIVYLVMWIGAFGIMLGLFYHVSCLAFVIPYWYVFLLDKSSWNNHSYLYGVLSILLLGSQANRYGSLDILIGKVKRNSSVPLWNYFILRFQIFVLYFFAGLKKLDKDWLQGYSMRNLGNHWIFEPFQIILTSEQVDFWIIHLNGFALDFSIGFFLLYNKTRPYALCVLGLFHAMNSQLFTIGMFPYVCLVTMPIFCDTNWPRKILKIFSLSRSSVKDTNQDKKCTPPLPTEGSTTEQMVKKFKEVPTQTLQIGWKHNLVAFLLISHIGLQAFLPYSHFITKGYNNWTSGLYGYSWDMMVHTWDTVLAVVRVVDHETRHEHFIDPEAWVQSNRWEKHADMVIQYTQCLRRNLLKGASTNKYRLSSNISIHVDVWCSLNGRFQQRMYDPRVDLLTAEWSPIKEVSWVMPLLTEFSSWREKITTLEKEVYSWSEYSDVIFVADFPDLTLENYISEDLTNITLTVLEGDVVVEIDNYTVKPRRKKRLSISRHRITKDESVGIPAKVFHRVHTVSKTPACYMYSYVNHTKQLQEENDTENPQTTEVGKKNNRLLNKLVIRLKNMARAIGLVVNAILNILYSVPMIKRVRIVQ
ncbi:vitamin K-dependent gamma-carboxylase isoform X2 [Zootermopsis nevadensis]|uniref:Vitamin K-dependent gamma-carboxylase n=2 Tax=Zootermopsis nevadensis TaxID=136037 RepID=A0A067RAJ9_ZOONE|nr:vitamin K-dependent gamma-carboxylase isoform X2 [Zootermopsis nevadensis]KDR20856.1 Vitamin K-dependent gamma-carboxylase [Zootermopsis nevadensis]